jgi:hypothetical protein
MEGKPWCSSTYCQDDLSTRCRWTTQAGCFTPRQTAPRPSSLELVRVLLHIRHITTMKPKLRSKINLPRMRHTFYTPTTHSWFRSKMIETLIAHVHSFCNWPGTHIHVSISACLPPFLQEKKNTFQFMPVWRKMCTQMWNRHNLTEFESDFG